LGIAYDTKRGRLVVGGYSNTVYFCTPPATSNGTWVWTTQVFGGYTVPPNNPGTSTADGIWNKWAYSELFDGIMIISWADVLPTFIKF